MLWGVKDGRITDRAIFYAAMHAFGHVYLDSKMLPMDEATFQERVEMLHVQILAGEGCRRCRVRAR